MEESSDGLSGLNRAFGDPQGFMVAPGVLAGGALGAGLRGDGIPVGDDDAGDAPLTGTTGLTAAQVNRRDAGVREVTLHKTLPVTDV
jgi:hypothetical protein